MPPAPSDTLPIVVLAPHGRDGGLICERLGREGLRAAACADAAALGAALADGAGMVVVTEEVFAEAAPAVRRATADAPAWSELPVLLLLRPGRRPGAGLALAEPLGGGVDVTALARPVPPDTLVAFVQNALVARRRQFEVGALLGALREGEATSAASSTTCSGSWPCSTPRGPSST